MKFTFAFQIILILVLIGGSVAIIGDRIGKRIGKKRLTIFNLRPRHTAILITALTGILIALTTLLIVLLFSQNARTALFGLEGLKRDVAEKSQQLERSRGELSSLMAEQEKVNLELQEAKTQLDRSRLEIAALENTREKFKKQAEISRKGKVLFNVGEILVTSVIKAGPERGKLEAGLKQVLSAADLYVRNFGVNKEGHLILVTPEDFEKAIETLQKKSGENIVALAATQNTLFGETVPVRIEIYDNRLVYRSGESISEADIPYALSIQEIGQQIQKVLLSSHEKARRDGVFPDQTGSIGSIPYSQILSLAKKIKDNKKPVKLKITAKTDTYAVGPLNVDFKIFYQ